jgi:signal transduction histidine kinase/DNA-binding response OmpR family regulator
MTVEQERINILLVDDEPRNLQALELVLAAPDRNLVSAASGEEALKRLLEADFAVILLDVRMPGLDGFETAELIRNRERSRTTPIIFLTADTASSTMAWRGYSVGAVDYILKPFDTDVLRSKVSVFVELYRKTAQVRHQADQLAMLNLRLAHRSEWLEAKLGILAGLTEALQNRAPIETLVDDLLMRCIDAAGGSRGAAYLLDTTGALVLHAHLGYGPDAADALASCFGAGDLALAALERGTPIAISAQSPVDDASDLLDRAQVKTLTIAPMSLGDEQLGVLLLGSEENELGEDQSAFARVIAGQAGQALVLARAAAQVRSNERRLALLADASSELATAPDLEAVLQRIADLTVRTIGDFCAIDLLGEDGTVRRVAMSVSSPELRGLGEELRLNPPDPASGSWVHRVLRTGRSSLLATIGEEDLAALAGNAARRRVFERIGPTSALVVPLVARDRTLGGLTLISRSREAPLNLADLTLMEDLARRIASALENARLYDEAKAALRIRDEFFAAASHDLKTPLTAIKGQAQVLRRRAEQGTTIDPKRIVETMDRIDIAATKMVTMVEELLDVAKIQTGQMLELTREPTDLVALVYSVAGEIPRDPGHNIEVASTVEELVGAWDATRLERVLANLIGNAIKYSPDGGTIHIGLSTERDLAVITVQDEGVGIPRDEVPKVFERFYRGRNVVGKIAGTGIGLAGVRQIVEQHGGDIRVESHEGEGSTFIVRLPIVSDEETTPIERDAPALSA